MGNYYLLFYLKYLQPEPKQLDVVTYIVAIEIKQSYKHAAKLSNFFQFLLGAFQSLKSQYI